DLMGSTGGLNMRDLQVAQSRSVEARGSRRVGGYALDSAEPRSVLTAPPPTKGNSSSSAARLSRKNDGASQRSRSNRNEEVRALELAEGWGTGTTTGEP